MRISEVGAVGGWEQIGVRPDNGKGGRRRER